MLQFPLPLYSLDFFVPFHLSFFSLFSFSFSHVLLYRCEFYPLKEAITRLEMKIDSVDVHGHDDLRHIICSHFAFSFFDLSSPRISPALLTHLLYILASPFPIFFLFTILCRQRRKALIKRLEHVSSRLKAET